MSLVTDRDTRLHRFIAAAIESPIVLDVAALMAERDELKRKAQSAERRAEDEHEIALAAAATLRQSEQRAQDAGQLLTRWCGLADALVCYAQHRPECDSHQRQVGTNVACPCSCGLETVLGDAVAVAKEGAGDAGQ